MKQGRRQSPPKAKRPLQPFEIKVDLGVHSLSALKKAAYRLSHDFAFAIRRVGRSSATVTFHPKALNRDRAGAINTFLTELIDEDLRETISRETEGIRNLIMAHALSRLPLLNPELEDSEYPDGLSEKA